MCDNVDFCRLRISDDGFYPSTQMHHSGTIVCTTWSIICVTIAPCCCVDFSRCVALVEKIVDRCRPTGSRWTASIQCTIRIAMDEYDRFFGDLKESTVTYGTVFITSGEALVEKWTAFKYQLRRLLTNMRSCSFCINLIRS
jgi:hypothetical protein